MLPRKFLKRWDRSQPDRPVRRRGSPERAQQLILIKCLNRLGFVAGKVKTVGTFKGGSWVKDPYQMKGLPDVFAFHISTRVLFAVEMKYGDNTQTPEQRLFEKLFHNPPDRFYFLAYSAQEALEKLERIVPFSGTVILPRRVNKARSRPLR